jgi:hypothetical protein
MLCVCVAVGEQNIKCKKTINNGKGQTRSCFNISRMAIIICNACFKYTYESFIAFLFLINEEIKEIKSIAIIVA